MYTRGQRMSSKCYSQVMQYFFRKHEENFKEWRNAGYQGITPFGAEFLKHLRSRHFKQMLFTGYAILFQKTRGEFQGMAECRLSRHHALRRGVSEASTLTPFQAEARALE